jgi:predicted NBD/HSP70 family sugar kinase
MVGAIATGDRVRYRYTITMSDQRPHEVNCRCAIEAEAVIAGFEHRANFDASIPGDPTVAAAERACAAHIDATCRNAVFVRDPAGIVVGGLGVGVR